MEWTPEALADSVNYWKARALLTALELDLFTPLAAAPRNAVELAAAVDADPEALTFLLDALAGFELLEKRDDDYALTRFAREHLVPGTRDYLGHLPLSLARDWALWGRFTRRLRRGRAYWKRGEFRGDVFLRDPRGAALLARGLKQSAFAHAPALLDRLAAAGLSLDGHGRLLDVGGGHGVYTAAFCVRWPTLRATVFDLPAPLEVARETARELQIEPQVDFVAGDFRHDPLPTGHDLALLSYVLHGPGPLAARRLLAAAHEALEPGGRILVQEIILSDDRTRPAWGALFALNLLMHTPNGRCYTRSELSALLEEAGFREIAIMDEERVVAARKP